LCWDTDTIEAGLIKYKNLTIRTEEELFDALYELTEEELSIEIALRRIGKGLCPKSFPVSSLSVHLIDVVDICQGGITGTDLVMLPYPQFSIFDQPNIFFQARNLINQVRAQYFKEKEPQKDK